MHRKEDIIFLQRHIGTGNVLDLFFPIFLYYLFISLEASIPLLVFSADYSEVKGYCPRRYNSVGNLANV